MRKGVIAVVGVIVVIGAVWFYLNRPGKPVPPVVDTGGQQGSPETVTAEPTRESLPPVSSNQVAAAATATTNLAATNPPPPPPPDPPWKRDLDRVLASSSSADDKAKQLWAMLPNLDTNGQTVVTGELVKLLTDDKFTMVQPLLMNPKSPETVMDVVMANLYDRPAKMKLPLWLAVAEVENHPLREEALSVLEVYVEQDFGTNMAAWRQAVDAKLKAEQP